MAVTAGALNRTSRVRGTEQARVQNLTKNVGQLTRPVSRREDTPGSACRSTARSSQNSSIVDTEQAAVAGDLELSAVTFGAMWRRSVIVIWCIDLFVTLIQWGVSVLHSMGCEALRLRDSARRQLELREANTARKGNGDGFT